MQSINRLSLVIAVGATIFLGACSSTPVGTEVQTSTRAPSAVNQPTAHAASSPVTKGPIAAHLDPASLLVQRRSVYFDFDQANLKTDYATLLELHGKYLAAHPNIAIKVEGNTDELGGTEYNLALGQKRAEAVVSALKIYGVKGTQMEAVSFGKEKPREMGHEEAAYKQNRRADLVYPTH
jgi:peptidoglycan-associated lipoprotein